MFWVCKSRLNRKWKIGGFWWSIWFWRSGFLLVMDGRSESGGKMVEVVENHCGSSGGGIWYANLVLGSAAVFDRHGCFRWSSATIFEEMVAWVLKKGWTEFQSLRWPVVWGRRVFRFGGVFQFSSRWWLIYSILISRCLWGSDGRCLI